MRWFAVTPAPVTQPAPREGSICPSGSSAFHKTRRQDRAIQTAASPSSPNKVKPYTYATDATFGPLPVEGRIARALEEMGYTEPTPIQEQVVPLVRNGRDLVGQAQTGTGKTAAFGIPLVEKVDPDIKSPQALGIDSDQRAGETGQRRDCPPRQVQKYPAPDNLWWAGYEPAVDRLGARRAGHSRHAGPVDGPHVAKAPSTWVASPSWCWTRRTRC